MVETNIDKLTQPPDFEIRADKFLDQAKRYLNYAWEPTFFYASNETKELPKILERGIKFLTGRASNLNDNTDGEIKELAESVIEIGKGLEDVLGEDLESLGQQAQKQIDVQSATENEIEITIVDGSRKMVKEFVKRLDKLALQFDGKRRGGKLRIYQHRDERGDFSVRVSYIFR